MKDMKNEQLRIKGIVLGLSDDNEKSKTLIIERLKVAMNEFHGESDWELLGEEYQYHFEINNNDFWDLMNALDRMPLSGTAKDVFLKTYENIKEQYMLFFKECLGESIVDKSVIDTIALYGSTGRDPKHDNTVFITMADIKQDFLSADMLRILKNLDGKE